MGERVHALPLATDHISESHPLNQRPRSVHLNHLRTFVVLFETRSATIAADKLHVTQPTVSYTLRALRRRFGDELFRREKHEFVPTSMAMRLYPPLREALAQIDETVSGGAEFDASAFSGVITVALSSMGVQTFLPRIVTALRREAPLAHLKVVPLVAAEAEDALVRGLVDLAMSARLLPADRLWRTSFVPVEYVAVTSAEHPLPDTSPDMFEGRWFLQVGSAGGHVYPNDALAEYGLASRVAVHVEGYTAVPGVLECSDLVGLLPRRVAEIFAERHALKARELPFEVHSPPVSVYTRPESALSPPQRWFRELTLTSAKA